MGPCSHSVDIGHILKMKWTAKKKKKKYFSNKSEIST